MQRSPQLFGSSDEQGIAILHSILGMITEAGELAEILHKVLTGAEGFDPVHFVEEIGDSQWYEAIGVDAVHSNFDSVQRAVIAKLRHRFPEKFSEFDANNRDLLGERKALEQLQFKGHPVAAMAEVAGKQFAILNYWTHDNFSDVLWGNVSSHPRQTELEIGNPTAYVHTSKIVQLNVAEGYCETKNTIFALGVQGAKPAT